MSESRREVGRRMSEQTIMIHGTQHTVTQCGVCGVWYVVPTYAYQCHQRLGGFSFCPNGHQWGWKTGEEQRQQDQIRQERDRLKQDRARLEDELAAEKRRAEAAETRTLQVRRRAASGVCPCCNRTFMNVRNHIKNKHPNIVPLQQKVLP
jgi:hypothetical protein